MYTKNLSPRYLSLFYERQWLQHWVPPQDKKKKKTLTSVRPLKSGLWRSQWFGFCQRSSPQWDFSITLSLHDWHVSKWFTSGCDFFRQIGMVRGASGENGCMYLWCKSKLLEDPKEGHKCLGIVLLHKTILVDFIIYTFIFKDSPFVEESKLG